MPYSRIIFNYDDQLLIRFPVIRYLEPFRIKENKNKTVFKQFLKRFSVELPFNNITDLSSEDLYPRLFAFSKGNMRRLRNLINYACEVAICNDDHELTLEHFSEAFDFYMTCIDDRYDEIDASEKLSSQPNPFSEKINNLYYKKMIAPSAWNMKADSGESPIVPARYTDQIPLRSLL